MHTVGHGDFQRDRAHRTQMGGFVRTVDPIIEGNETHYQWSANSTIPGCQKHSSLTSLRGH